VYILGRLHVNSEKYLLASSSLSVIRLSFCLFSVFPHLSARLLLERFLWNFILGTSMKICQKVQILLKLDKNIRQQTWWP